MCEAQGLGRKKLEGEEKTILLSSRLSLITRYPRHTPEGCRDLERSYGARQPGARASRTPLPVWDAAGALRRGREGGGRGRAVVCVGCGGVRPRRALRVEMKMRE